MSDKLASGRYRYRLYLGIVDGKPKYKSFTADTPRKARKAADQWAALHPTMTSDPTLSEACEAFLANRTSTLSPNTFADYSHKYEYLKTHYPDIFKMHLTAMTSEKLQELVNRLAVKRKANNPERFISAKTVSEYYGFLQSVLSSYGITPRVKLPQRKRPELNIPEDDAVKAFLKEIQGSALEIPVLLAALGPMRRSEICALRMEDIEGNVIHVRRSMAKTVDKDWIVKLPKSDAGTRDVVMPQEVIDLIKAQGYVTRCNPDTLTHHFIRTAKRNGLHCRFHDLRHYSASFQLALGIPPLYVMERGGWSSPQTMRRYLHVLDKQREEFSAAANAAFTEALLS